MAWLRGGTISFVTTKDALHDIIDALTDSEAEKLLKLAEETFEPGPLTEEDHAAIERGLADIRAGRVVSTEEVRRRFNLPG